MRMHKTQRLWRWLGLVCALSFAALGYIGWQIYLQAPPIPKAVASSDGRTLFTHDDIVHGQQAWLASGGQQQGSVWGHGSYVAPDWSADWLHREALELRQILAEQRFKRPYEQLAAEEQGAIDSALRSQMRRNRYDAASDTLSVTPERADAIRRVAAHFDGVFGNAPALAELRAQYAMTDDELPNATDRHALTAFFFWTAWAASTDRPGETDLSYTSNWPHEPLVGNHLTGTAAMWSMVSII
jgi:nitric oxide reductase subunit B